MDGMQAKRKELQHGRLAYMVSQSRTLGYKSSWYSTSLSFSSALECYSRLPFSLREEEYQSSKLLLLAGTRSAFKSKTSRGKLFFLVDEVYCVRDLVYIWGRYQNVRKHDLKGLKGTSLQRAVVSMCQQAQGAPFFGRPSCRNCPPKKRSSNFASTAF